jgi:hypothetical protein
VGIPLFVRCAGFPGPKESGIQQKIPRFLVICGKKTKNVSFRVWVFDGEKEK